MLLQIIESNSTQSGMWLSLRSANQPPNIRGQIFMRVNHSFELLKPFFLHIHPEEILLNFRLQPLSQLDPIFFQKGHCYLDPGLLFVSIDVLCHLKVRN